MIIVIDGPAGSGKSSTAKAVAERLKIQYLDSGALYRVATLVFLNSDRNRVLFLEQLNVSEISFYFKENFFHVTLNNEDVSEKIREMRVSGAVSEVAAMPKVREFVNNLMRKTVASGVYIADGRDLGTAVFPDAELKIFMVADIKDRALRRFEELKKAGKAATLKEVEQNIASRDELDSSRKADPLKQAQDAILINTSELTFDEQVKKICKYAEKVIANKNI